MSEDGADSLGSPLAAGRRVVRNGWRMIKSIYYANSPSWRVLKSGALVFLGFFLWAGSNVLYSYNQDLAILRFTMAYGFALLLYGPVHHLVVLPLALRWRRGGSDARARLGRRLPNAMLTIFLVAVLVLGAFPAGPVMVDFRGTLEAGGTPDVSPDLLCVKGAGENDTSIHCHLTESRGIDRVAVVSGDQQLVVDDEPPFEFTIRESELEEVVGQKQFTVQLLDADGNLIRQYTRRLAMIPEG